MQFDGSQVSAFATPAKPQQTSATSAPKIKPFFIWTPSGQRSTPNAGAFASLPGQTIRHVLYQSTGPRHPPFVWLTLLIIRELFLLLSSIQLSRLPRSANFCP